MNTTLKSLKELAKGVDETGLSPKIEPVRVNWVRNKALEGDAVRFRDCSEGNYHPVVVVAVEGQYADVRMMTSDVDRNLSLGVLYEPGPEVRLKKEQSVILTRKNYHLRIPVAELRQADYLGDVPSSVLAQIWITEIVRDIAGNTGSMVEDESTSQRKPLGTLSR